MPRFCVPTCLTALLAVALVAPAGAREPARTVEGRAYHLSDVIVQPEGIATRGKQFYTGSSANRHDRRRRRAQRQRVNPQRRR